MTTANRITIFRILLIPFFVVEILYYVRTGNETHRVLGIVSFAVAALFYLAFGSVHSLPLAVLFVVLAHFGGSTIWVFSTVMLQRSVPNELQGRVFAAELALFTLTFSISTFIYGRWVDQAGADLFALMRSLGWCFLVPGVLWALAARAWPLRHVAGPEASAPTPPLEEMARAAD